MNCIAFAWLQTESDFSISLHSHSLSLILIERTLSHLSPRYYKTTGDTAVNSLQFWRGDSSGLLIKIVQCDIYIESIWRGGNFWIVPNNSLDVLFVSNFRDQKLNVFTGNFQSTSFEVLTLRATDKWSCCVMTACQKWWKSGCWINYWPQALAETYNLNV